LHVPVIAKLFGGAVKVGNVVTALLLIRSMNISTASLIAVVILLSIVVYMMFKLLRTRRWDRNAELKKMSIMEIATIYAGMFTVMPIQEAITLAIFGIAWFTAMNRYLWETKLTPRV
jgi:O-antigen/teichoic acid export membrane protein